jgi:thymidylate synthase (FAD)
MAVDNSERAMIRNASVVDRFGARPCDHTQSLAEMTLHTYGKVALLATYGSDELIVDAARVSYGAGTKTTRDSKHLIRYLLRHRHTSPFEQAELTFYLRLPIFVARQLVRHRTANLNEYSARYSELSSDFYVPTAEYLAKQAVVNRQGRADLLSAEDAEHVQQLFVDAQETSVRIYRELLDTYGLAREIARVPTSVGMYTEMYWKCDLHNFMHFLKLRLDPHAQREIVDFAEVMYKCAEPYFPLTFDAFEDYLHRSYTLSAMEIRMLGTVLQQFKTDLATTQWPENVYGMSAREHADFCTFLDTLIS